MSSESTTESPQIATEVEPKPEPTPESLSENLSKMSLTTKPSFTIWPPTQRTRDAVTNRLIETLSSSPILSKRYGQLTPEESSDAAKSIESAAFESASSAVASDPTHDESIDAGIQILQVYSKEISKRVLQAVKAKSQLHHTASVNESETETETETESGSGSVSADVGSVAVAVAADGAEAVDETVDAVAAVDDDEESSA